MLAGLPGSGKSTWVEGKAGVLSSDAIRFLLSDDPEDQTIHRRVFGLMREILRHRLELARPVTYIDATNLTEAERRPYIKLSEMCGADIEVVFFDVSPEECKRRNSKRPRMVPDGVIDQMAARLSQPNMKEGFVRVTVLGSQGVL